MAITLTRLLMSEGVLGSGQQPHLEAVFLCSCELVETLESFLSVRVLDTARGGKISSRFLSSLTYELLLLEGRLLSKILDSEDFTLVGSVETGNFHFYIKPHKQKNNETDKIFLQLRHIILHRKNKPPFTQNLIFLLTSSHGSQLIQNTMEPEMDSRQGRKQKRKRRIKELKLTIRLIKTEISV